MKALIFFDINGTIIKRDSRTDLPYEYAVNQLLNIENSLALINTSARSDKDVLMEILDKNNLEFSNEIWQRFLQVYQEKLEEFRVTDVWRENADAVNFINNLSDKGYPLALITGELNIGAKYKLSKLNIWDKFITGGFGEDGLKRFEIAEKALDKTEKITEKKFTDLYIIGDTILDIKTARHLGAKIISIATGSNSYEELKAENPDYLIKKFSELKIF